MQYKVFGCKVNKYYTDKWLNSQYLSDKSGVFIASCVVTDKAKKKRVKFVKDIFRDGKLKKNTKVYISGCGAFKNGRVQEDFFILYPELEVYKKQIEILGENPPKNSSFLVFQDKGKKIKKLSSLLKPDKAGNAEKKDIKEVITRLKKINISTKKFVLIQGGCDSFCTFCLTVMKRGRHFFRDKEDIRDEILEFESTGGKEVVLTGVNLSAWGLETTRDTKNSKFAELLKYLLLETSIPRIRISSLGPEFIDDECLEVFREERIYPYFHFSVQSGSSKILRGMKRQYDGGYIKDLLIKTKNIKRDDKVKISLGADIIVGFPGETEFEFKETYDLIKKIGIQKIHVFPFSPHKTGETVLAGSFENQVDDRDKKERIKKLTKLGDEIRDNFIISQKTKTLEVLIESVKGDNWKGWTQNYIEANERNFRILKGVIKRNELIEGVLV